VEETEQIMEAGIQFGLKPKIHVNQFNRLWNSGCKIQGPSVDHLEIMKPEDIEALKKHGDNACCITFLLYFFEYSLYSSTK
jgi:imidazolonepropionase